MSRYEDLTEKQKELYNTLKDAIENEKDITPILKEIKKEGALKEVLTTANIIEKLEGVIEYNLTPLGYAMTSNNFEEIIRVILKEIGDKKEVLTTANITKKLPNGTKYNLTPLGYAMSFNNPGKKIKTILDVVQKNSVLEELLNSMKENDRANLKKILETFKNQEQNEEQNNKIDGWLKSISIYESNISKKDAVKTANQSIIIGSICGVIAALAVGGGCFAAGVALPILALIGIAVAAAVLTGLVAGGITYEVCKPCNELNEVAVQSEVSSQSSVTV